MSNTLNLGTDGNWATKEDSLLAYNSENGNFKPLPFDFTRASSATVVNKDGLIETVGSGEPRIDYKDDSKGALLLEPTRSNFVTYSESFLGTSGSASLTNSDALSPYGSINGFKISEVSTNSYQSRIYTNISYVGGSSYTVYVFAKASTNDRFVLFGQQSSQPIVGYDLTNGAILTESNVTSSFIDNYGNGWYRCGFTYTSALTQTSQYGINLIKEGTTNTYIYNGNTNQNVLFFGASLEQGSYATSYIPTQGSAVTRVKDLCVNTVPENIVNEDEMTLYCEFEYLGGGDTIPISVHNGGGSVIWLAINNNFTIYGTNFYSSVFNASATSTTVLLPNTKYKVAYRTKSGDSVLYIDGILEASSNDVISNPNTLNKVELGSFWNGTNQNPNLKIIDAKCYNSGLSNAELQALTSN